MLKENWRSIARIERCFDAAIVVGSFVLAHWLRGLLPLAMDVFPSTFVPSFLFSTKLTFSSRAIAPLKDYVVLLLVSLASHLFSLESQGAYGSMRLRSPWWLLRISVVSSFAAFVSLGTIAFVLKLDPSRAFIFLHCSVASIGLLAQRSVVFRVLRYWRGKGRNFRNLVVCGSGSQAARLIRDVARRPELGIRVRGIASLEKVNVGGAEMAFRAQMLESGFISNDCQVVAGVEALTHFLTEMAVDEVLFADYAGVLKEVEEMVIRCSEQGVRTTLVADLFSFGVTRSELSYFGSMPLIHYQTPPGDRWDLSLKRIIDILVSAVALVLMSPLCVWIAYAIQRDSPGPILFKQKRVGLNGRLFSLYKFRSMYPNAEDLLASLREENEMSGPAFKLTNDPRVTKVGRWIRRHSLDELPQLWNVFRGDMSLVGPRPPLPHEVRLYDRRERRRLSMRPGLTCTWQVSGRSDITDFESWVQLDLEYIDNWSLGRDFSLLARTVPAVLFGSGAR